MLWRLRRARSPVPGRGFHTCGRKVMTLVHTGGGFVTRRTGSAGARPGLPRRSNRDLAVARRSPSGPRVLAQAESLETRRLFDGLLLINDVSVTEGDSGSPSLLFTLTRLYPNVGAPPFIASTSDGTASAAEGDYVSRQLVLLQFMPGEASKFFRVQVNPAYRDEGNETVIVPLQFPGDAAIVDGTGVGTILEDDDHPPSVLIPPISPDPRETPVNSATITWSEDMQLFGREDLRLTRDGVDVPITTAQTWTSADTRSYVLGNLAGLTAAPGNYVLSVPDARL